MEEKVLKAALAGLLHDVGKIQQRALTVPRVSAPGFEDEGQPAHATYSAYFMQNHVPQAYRAAALAGAYHHVPERSPAQDNYLSKLVALADKLSAGERVDEEFSKKNAHPRQMMTIFDRISLEKVHKEKDAKDRKYLPLRPLSLSNTTLFPVKKQDKDSEGDGYQILLDTLSSTARRDPGDMQSYVENMLGAMQTAAWCVPSAYYYSAPDVSLYDHSRMTAALAACMAERPDSEIDSLLKAAREAFKEKGRKALPDTPVALLIGGDISGIQKFIYTITSKKAAQTLRGRSFYLQLLTEAVLRFVLNELGMPYTNVIYSGGGHFFLLAPVSAEEKLPALRKEITKKILIHHGTSLYFALGFTQVPAYEFEAGKFPKAWDRMHADLGKAKSQRYTELGDEMHERVFAIAENGGNPDTTCSVCGGDALSIVEESGDEDESSVKVCSMCDSFSKKLGKTLPETKFAALGWQKAQDTESSTFEESLTSFGLQIRLLKNEKDSVTFKGVERITFWALDDSGAGYPSANGLPATNLLRYTVNIIPVWQEGGKKGEIITFDELQEKVKGGFKRLGVLRMDVDNLGDVFKKGLGDFATLARISTLSFQMSLFFEGWVKRICEKFDGKIYAVYAGGDDVFLIGPWDVMPDLAINIRDDFAKYTAHHPDLHISAGLAFIGGKYPIYQAAEDAEVILKSAKKKDGKNSFGFIGHAWTWTEFLEVQDKFKRIVNIVSDKKDGGLGGPNAIIQTLRELAEMKLERQKGDKEIWGPWQWRGAYLLKRMEERTKDELAQEIQSIRDSLDKNGYSDLKQWGAAARWAQLKTRKKSVKNDELA